MKHEIKETQSKIQSLLDEMRELGQPRSDYMLRHFVVGQHDTPAVQRKQVLDELQALMFALGDMNDELEIANIDKRAFDEQAKTAKGFDLERIHVEIRKANRKALSLELSITGRLRECETLLALLETMPKVSREEYEHQQPEYWQRRLTRQFFLGQRDHGGNLDAILQMATEPGQFKPSVSLSLEQILPLISEHLQVVNSEDSRNLPAGNGS